MRDYNITLYLNEDKIEMTVYGADGVVKTAAVPFNEEVGGRVLAESLWEAAGLAGQGRVKRLVCPGGIFKPLRRGLYLIDDKVCEAAQSGEYGHHDYNRLVLTCFALAQKAGGQALMFNPLSCDELLPLNRVSGLAGVNKKSRYYACEHSALLALGGREMGKRPDELNAVVVWLGDDVSVGAHWREVCIAVNDMVGGEGPMGFASAGDLPVAQLAALFFTGSTKPEDLAINLREKGGVLAYAGTKDPVELEKKVQDSCREAQLALAAVAYQTAKWVGICSLALEGKVDLIVVGGKGTLCDSLMTELSDKVEAIAPVILARELDIHRFLQGILATAGMVSNPIYEY